MTCEYCGKRRKLTFHPIGIDVCRECEKEIENGGAE